MSLNNIITYSILEFLIRIRKEWNTKVAVLTVTIFHGDVKWSSVNSVNSLPWKLQESTQFRW